MVMWVFDWCRRRQSVQQKYTTIDLILDSLMNENYVQLLTINNKLTSCCVFSVEVENLAKIFAGIFRKSVRYPKSHFAVSEIVLLEIVTVGKDAAVFYPDYVKRGSSWKKKNSCRMEWRMVFSLRIYLTILKLRLYSPLF